MADRPHTAGAGNRAMFWKMILFAGVRRRGQAAMAVLCATLGAATLLCLATICLVVPAQMSIELRSYGANLIVTADGGFDDATVASVTRTVEQAAPAKHASYRYESVRINSAPYTLAGIDAQDVHALNRHWNVDGDWPSAGNVMMGRDVADGLGVKVDSSVTIGMRDGDEDADSGEEQLRNGRRSTSILDTDGVRMRVVGIVDTGGAEDSFVYMSDSDLGSLAGVRGADVLEFASECTDDDLTALTGRLQQAGSANMVSYRAHQVTRMTASNARIITMLRMLFGVVSIVALALTLVGVSTTMSSIVSRRRSEIGLRRALGATSRSIAGEFLVESAVYGVAGGVIGCVIGYGIAYALCAQVFDRRVGFSWWLAALCVLVSVALAVIASIGPVRRATRIDPAVVLREE